MAGMLIQPHVPKHGSSGCFGGQGDAAQLGENLMRSVFGKSSQIPPQPLHGAAASGQDGGPGLSLAGTPVGMRPFHLDGHHVLAGEGTQASRGQRTSWSSLQLSVSTLQNAHTGTDLWDLSLAASKRNISLFYPTIKKKKAAKREVGGMYQTIKYPQQLRERGGQEHRNQGKKKICFLLLNYYLKFLISRLKFKLQDL